MTQRLGYLTSIKYFAFQILKRLVKDSPKEHKESSCQRYHTYANPGGSNRCLWVYASTIGELNAIDPLIRELSSEMNFDHLIILSDHPHYQSAFQKSFPEARIAFLQDGEQRVFELLNNTRPELLLIAEIPCLLFDAPCRLPFAILYRAKRQDCKIVVANGWLYDEQPACRMDHLETTLFQKDYISAIDLFLMQREADAKTLRKYGVGEKQLEVTGNLKFDQLQKSIEENRSHPEDDILIFRGPAKSRTTIVAGCVTNISEQELVLDAFLQILDTHPEALLVLAPRHPENTDRMHQLRGMLEHRKLSYGFRSAGNTDLGMSGQVLILDTMGELRHFYAIGNVCYVGLNHNVLEPLAYNKPVVVTPGWNPKFPSYPVYTQLKSESVIQELKSSSPTELSYSILNLLVQSAQFSDSHTEIKNHIPENLLGTLGRDLDLIQQLMIR